MTPQQMSLIQAMLQVYCNYQGLYLLSVGCHWNVHGPDFYQYHTLFERIYESVYEAIDPFAEHTRELGVQVPFSLSDLAAMNAVPYPAPTSQPLEFVQALYDGHVVARESINKAADLAAAQGKQGLLNLLTGEAENVDESLYLLGSVLGK